MTNALRGYAVCATQRSGSTFACELLTSTGLLGNPLDYFNPAGRRAKGWTDFPGDYDAQLELIPRAGATPNGVYAMKVFPEHLDALDERQWTQRLPGLRWVYLRREDLLGQAISLVIAEQSGRWRSTAEALAEPRYDADAIRSALSRIASGDAQWRLFFARHGIRPLETTYEAVTSAPDGFVCAVAALAGVDDDATIDTARVTTALQRDERTAIWRDRFLGEQAARQRASSFTVAPGRRPRLSVHVLTRDAEHRLGRLIAEAQEYADEVVVGVDASSRDGTFELAAEHADVAYRFRLPRPTQLSPARMLAFEYATGDWILTLDDDESMEPAFGALVPALMRAPRITHCYFPRKWIVSEEPCEYVHAAPWFPNWAPRLFRNDPSLFWKPPEPHSMYFIEGPAAFDERAAILHFEPVWCTPEDRARKVASYRAAGARPDSETFYAPMEELPRRPATARRARTPQRRSGIVHSAVRVLSAIETPGWAAEFTSVDLPQTMRPGESAVGRATVRNAGRLAWSPTYAQWPANPWPMLRLSNHVRAANGALVDPAGGARTLLPRFVAPGEDVTFIVEFSAPERPGEYVIEWDMLSEGHTWFAACGSEVYRHALRVEPAPP